MITVAPPSAVTHILWPVGGGRLLPFVISIVFLLLLFIRSAPLPVRRLRPIIFSLVILLAFGLLTSCGGGSGGRPGGGLGNPGTLARDYTITLTGTADGGTRSINLALVVK